MSAFEGLGACCVWGQWRADKNNQSNVDDDDSDRSDEGGDSDGGGDDKGGGDDSVDDDDNKCSSNMSPMGFCTPNKPQTLNPRCLRDTAASVHATGFYLPIWCVHHGYRPYMASLSSVLLPVFAARLGLQCSSRVRPQHPPRAPRNGLPLWGGAQLAVDTTCVSPVDAARGHTRPPLFA